MIDTNMETPVGRLRLVASEEGLVALCLPTSRRKGPAASGEPTPRASDKLEKRAYAARRIFHGTRQIFSRKPSAPEGTPRFQLPVWQALREIPRRNAQLR